MTSNLANILDRNYPLRTLEMAFQNIKMQTFLGQHAPTTPLQFESSVLARFICDWKICQFYSLKRLDSLSFLFTLCLTQFIKARDFGRIHFQHNSYSHHICLLEFVRLKGHKIPQEMVMAIHHTNHNSVYKVNRFSPDSSHMFHPRHAIVCKFRKGNHLRQECNNNQYIANNFITMQYTIIKNKYV